MVAKIGDRVPAGIFRVMGDSDPQPISVDELFDGRRVVLFSVPGAFTAKSTTLHVPSYLAHADAIRALGVDAILCAAPNDAHVMAAWAAHCGVTDQIMMLADNHAEFFMALGLQMDCTRFGLGFRCQRFSLIAQGRQITHLNIEEPGQYAVSGAETILAQLQESANAGQGKERS